MGNRNLNFIIYYSKALVEFNHQNLKKLVTNSQQKNARLKVTGTYILKKVTLFNT